MSGAPGADARPLQMGVAFNLRSLSPLQNDDFVAGMLGSLVFSYLERIGPDLKLVPEVARIVPTRANNAVRATPTCACATSPRPTPIPSSFACANVMPRSFAMRPTPRGAQYAELMRSRFSNVPYTGSKVVSFNTERAV